MTDQEFYDFHTERLGELPRKIRDKAVRIVLEVLEDNDIAEIEEAANKNKLSWSSPYHFHWGMWMRNQLRKGGILDDALPSKNWDDYYIPIVELALGIRK